MRLSRHWIGPVVAATASVAFAAGPASAHATPGVIAFSSDRDGDADIYVMNGDGSGLRQITRDAAGDVQPALSPDGRSIAYAGASSGNYEIYVVDIATMRPRRLTTSAAVDGQPTWSPDGRRIAFVSNRHGNFELYSMGADGLALQRMTDTPGDEASPAWSGDGQRIAFQSTNDGNTDVYVMDASGSVERLTDLPGYEGEPAWSPDGTWIAFTVRAPIARTVRTLTTGETRGTALVQLTTNAEIWTMNATGGGLRQLTNDSAYDAEPTWSPDGHGIAFTSNRSGTFEIYAMDDFGVNEVRLLLGGPSDREPSWSTGWVSTQDIAFSRNGALGLMNADGSELRQLTGAAGYRDSSPAWSRDGRRIAFARGAVLGDGAHDLYVIEADGSGLRRLTSAPGWESLPTWSHDGRRIVFERRTSTFVGLAVINADGTGLRELPETAGALHPAWSPNGQEIAFYFEKGIHVQHADGTRTLVSRSRYGDQYPAWSPDGKKIAFYREGSAWVVNANGSGLRSLSVPLANRPTWSPDGQRIAGNDPFGASPNARIWVVNVASSPSSRTDVTPGAAADTWPAWSPVG